MCKIRILAASAVMALLAIAGNTYACTGITLKSRDGNTVLARTIEWGGSDLNSRYAIVPRGYTQSSYIPGGTKGGMTFTAKYGFVGLSVEQEEFVAEGLNEEGLSAGLFYFPGYGLYEDYNESLKATSIGRSHRPPRVNRPLAGGRPVRQANRHRDCRQESKHLR